MRFKNYDNLRIFNIVAKHGSFSAAALELNLTKGAVSYQIKKLEAELGFEIFQRLPRGISLTSKGHEVRHASQVAFDGIEQKITELRETSERTLTIGVSTYFASRWLSSRLMMFLNSNPGIRLRIQPMIDLMDLRSENVDLVIRWGDGNWTDMYIEPLFLCPSFPAASPDVAAYIRKSGLSSALNQVILLKDREGSHAWSHWHKIAGLSFKNIADTLTVPDPNVRVQAVIDGQGIALFDDLIKPELDAGQLVQISAHQLDDYGYFLAFPSGSQNDSGVAKFASWILDIISRKNSSTQ